MSEFFNWYTFLAFVLGVLLATTVKKAVSGFKGKLG